MCLYDNFRCRWSFDKFWQSFLNGWIVGIATVGTVYLKLSHFLYLYIIRKDRKNSQQGKSFRFINIQIWQIIGDYKCNLASNFWERRATEAINSFSRLEHSYILYLMKLHQHNISIAIINLFKTFLRICFYAFPLLISIA